MGKKRKATKKASTGRASRRGSSAAVQKQLQRLDRQIVELANQRAELLIQAGPAGAEVVEDLLHNPAAQQALLQRELQSSRGPLDAECVRAMFRELLSGSRALLKPLRVAYLGPEYSYSHLATIQRFGASAELLPVATIAAVFQEVHRGQAEFGLVPLENSTDGRVVDTLGMFARLPVRICGEVQLRIHHNLLARCPRSKIREVYSKPQALSQCRDWLAKHLPEARTVEASSTAKAAQWAAQKQGVAAIASRQAATEYALDVVAADIEDNRNNITRFAVIGGQSAPPSGNDRTALMFEIAHRAGALADTMVIFKRNRLNLTWIESLPMPDTENEYLFFVELEGHPQDADVAKALEALRRKTVKLELLGSFPQTEPVD